jgi:cytochrome P450
MNNDLPDTKPQILFGNLLNSGVLTGRLTFHEVMHNYQREYGDKFVYWFGSNPCFAFCLPEHAQIIFSDRHKFEQSPLFLPNFDLICPHAIMTLSGAKWKRHARVMLPVFKRAKVIQHLDTIIDCTDRFIDQSLTDKQVHTDLVRRCQKLTMNVIGFVALDYDIENQRTRAGKAILRPMIELIYSYCV